MSVAADGDGPPQGDAARSAGSGRGKIRPSRRSSPSRPSRHSRRRSVAAVVLTCLAFGLVWFAITAPDDISRLTPTAFVRVPLEAIIFLAIVLVLPPRAGRITALLAGVIVGLLAILKVLDMASFAALDRQFDPVIDWTYLGPAASLLVDSVGRFPAVALLVAAGVLTLAVLVLMPLSVLRVTRAVSRHRAGWLRTTAALAALWLLCAVLGVHVDDGERVASTTVTEYAYGKVSRIPAAIRDRQEFANAAAQDPVRSTPGDQLLSGLAGKDVMFVFVESYGRVALGNPALSPGVNAVLDSGTGQLRAAGFSAKSAFLTSPTFGGTSWLAHSTLQSGLWVDSPERYDVLLASQRLTLSVAFARAGWRTVADIPSNTHDWPQGVFYHYDKIYDARNVGYAGPRFGYATMPDQYTLDAFHRLELSNSDRRPVMAEIDLVSSHTPWSATPQLISQNQIGDGSVFDRIPPQAHPENVQAAYGQSIEYSMSSVISFVQSYGNDQLVLVILGDHQPATIVSGVNSDHDVPITILAHDPGVLDRIHGWGWQEGLRPGPDAPVWRMDVFRDRFLAAFGP